jgi:hypothetical protein
VVGAAFRKPGPALVAAQMRPQSGKSAFLNLLSVRNFPLSKEGGKGWMGSSIAATGVVAW